MTREEVKQRFKIIGDAPALNRAIDVAIQVAPTEVTVLVVGENGTGKDIFSKIIHQLSYRKHEKFIAINTGAIPEGTIDSELFGHEKGSFTSAYDARKGYFEEANGGIIFLDEIAEMPMNTQARLLRVLENGEFLRVGSSKVNKTDVRIVAATNRNLIEQIRKGKFREDLYFRLNTVTIQVPPLRERGEDIELLFRYFSSQFADQYGREPVRLSPDAVELLHKYHWPGNVRELKNFCEKVNVLTEGSTLSGEQMKIHLPLSENMLPVLASDLAYSEQSAGGGYFGAGQTSANGGGSDYQQFTQAGGPNIEFLYRVFFDLKQEISDLKYMVKESLEQQRGQSQQSYGDFYIQHQPQTGGTRTEQRGDEAPYLLEESLSLEAKEQDLIAKALRKHNQNRKKAAEELGISERTLYRKIKSYGLDKR